MRSLIYIYSIVVLYYNPKTATSLCAFYAPSGGDRPTASRNALRLRFPFEYSTRWEREKERGISPCNRTLSYSLIHVPKMYTYAYVYAWILPRTTGREKERERERCTPYRAIWLVTALSLSSSTSTSFSLRGEPRTCDNIASILFFSLFFMFFFLLFLWGWRSHCTYILASRENSRHRFVNILKTASMRLLLLLFFCFFFFFVYG